MPSNSSPLHIPTSLVENEHYQIKIATTAEELQQVYRLRFEVFNLELDEGFDSSYQLGIDKDTYDAQFLHLVVFHKPSHQIVATYRMQNYAMARAGLGFYSNSIFNMDALPSEVQQNMLELGRACIAKQHRNSSVFFLLWQGIAEILYENKLRYFFGCNSIPSRNPQDAHGIVKLLQTMRVYHKHFYLQTQPAYKCTYKDIEVDLTKINLPALFNLYLRFKCQICSAPALDRDFKTIVFLIVYDYRKVSDKYHKMFLGDRPRMEV